MPVIRWSRVFGFFMSMFAMTLIGGVHYVVQGIGWTAWRRAVAPGDMGGPPELLTMLSFPVLLAYMAITGWSSEESEWLGEAMVGNSITWGLAFVLIAHVVSRRIARKGAQTVANPVAKPEITASRSTAADLRKP